MVYRFCQKRKGFVVHFHNHASIAPTAAVTVGFDSRRKKENRLRTSDICLGTLLTFGRIALDAAPNGHARNASRSDAGGS
jgi:hypothetical protein